MATSESHQPLVFFKNLHGIFSELIGPPLIRQGMVERLLDEAFDSFDHYVSSDPESMKALACRGGCASCCSLRVVATAPEIFLIKHYLLKLQKARGAGFVRDLVARIERVHAATKGSSEQDRLEGEDVCPFIENGLCVIYSRRPLACRGHASFSEESCIEALCGDENADVPVSAPHLTARSLIQNSMQSALRDAGLAWGIYELNHALSIALNDDNCEAAWMAGEDVFAAALIEDIDQVEMAQTFDAIKSMAA